MYEVPLPLVVVAPHPDDAALACAGLIQQARGGVYLVHITAGDGFWRDAAQIYETPRSTPEQYLALGARRIGESREADAILGVPQQRQYQLGFPDGDMMRVVASGSVPVRSRSTGRAAVPYRDAYAPGIAYTSANLRSLLRQIFATVQPASIAYPSVRDANEDHRAVSMAVQGALDPASDATRMTYLVHHGLYPGVGLEWNRVLTVPEDLPPADAEVWMTRPQEHVKEQAIAAHKTQMEALGPWLLAFVAQNEPYWREGAA